MPKETWKSPMATSQNNSKLNLIFYTFGHTHTRAVKTGRAFRVSPSPSVCAAAVLRCMRQHSESVEKEDGLWMSVSLITAVYLLFRMKRSTNVVTTNGGLANGPKAIPSHGESSIGCSSARRSEVSPIQNHVRHHSFFSWSTHLLHVFFFSLNVCTFCAGFLI